MPTLLRSRAPSAILAVWGSLLVILLLAAAGAGVDMDTTARIHGLRFTPSAMALTILPIPALAWVVVLWSRSAVSPAAKTLRVVATLVLVLVSIAVAVMTVFVIFVRPVERLQ